jgi:hypothetical protein
MADNPFQRCIFVLKPATLEAKNVLAHCHGEEPMSSLFTTLLALCFMASINLFSTST